MKLLLADDLKSIHRYLEACVPWEQEHITEIYHAYNGQECVDLVKRYRPDILLLDIKMPIYNGVEVLQMIAEYEFTPQVLIISAYNDFQYVRQALKYGVNDYLMKPVDSAVLLQSVREIVAHVRRQCLSNIKSYLLDLPIEGKRADIQEDLSRLGLRWINCAQVVLSGNMQRIEAAAEFLLSRYPFGVALTPKELLVLIPADGSTAELDRFCQYIRELNRDPLVVVCAGISERLDVAEEGLQTAFTQSCDAAACRYFTGGTVFPYDKNAFGTIDQTLVGRYKILLTKVLLEGSRGDVRQTVVQMFQSFNELRPERRQLVDACYSILIYSINYLFVSYNSTDTELTERTLLDKLDRCQSIDRLQQVFLEELMEKAEAGTPSRHLRKDQLIGQVQRYLQDNYMQPLTLETLSSQFFISKYELCRKFKAVTGENLWEHIAGIRIRQAKHLLRNSALRISEIAECVGYHDSTYFSNMFKRQVGVSPKQYREQGKLP